MKKVVGVQIQDNNRVQFAAGNFLITGFFCGRTKSHSVKRSGTNVKTSGCMVPAFFFLSAM